MSFVEDVALIEEVVEHLDPSFAEVPRGSVDQAFEHLRDVATSGDADAFVLAAMRLLALPRNGHTRLIPNAAIRILPLRFVAMGASVFLTRAPAGSEHLQSSQLVAVNGVPVDEISRRAKPFLAGIAQRQRVIGSILLVWPAALDALGLLGDVPSIAFALSDATGSRSEITFDTEIQVSATELYPVGEHGDADPTRIVQDYADVTNWPGLGLAIRLPSFFDPTEHALQRAINRAADAVQSHPDVPLVVDVRGNVGGDFLRTLPLIDAIAGGDDRRPVAVLIDKFTFSAAIVFVGLLRDRLGARLTLIGEDMGDGTRFHAEGDTLHLPASGAAIRYSSAFHDWETGQADATTPAEIARHLRPVGKLAPDRYCVATAQDPAPSGLDPRTILAGLR